MGVLAWAVISGSVALAAETIFRAGGGYNNWHWWPILVTMAIAVNYSVWRMMGAGPWVTAVLAFTAVTWLARTGMSYLVFRDTITVGQVAGVILVLAALFLSSFWR